MLALVFKTRPTPTAPDRLPLRYASGTLSVLVRRRKIREIACYYGFGVSRITGAGEPFRSAVPSYPFTKNGELY
jgi:hypothetical protein